MQPGRSCPLTYRYTPAAVGAAPAFACETLYVIGGLYGNDCALDAILGMAAAEVGPVKLAFNGDFHWFDRDPAVFARIDAEVLRHRAFRGNVETELAGDGEAGCGCAYPATVSDAEVERSNAIMATLRDTARACAAASRLAALPMYGLATIAGLRVAIVHGDLHSLAGWSYAYEALGDGAALAADCAAAQVRIVASSHTCLPVALEVETAAGRCVLMNNGAAGMPNFADTDFGLVTRIGTAPARDALYGTRLDGLYVDAVPVRYDTAVWRERFLAQWPAGSAAHESYFRRIVSGPRHHLHDALRWRTPAVV